MVALRALDPGVRGVRCLKPSGRSSSRECSIQHLTLPEPSFVVNCRCLHMLLLDGSVAVVPLN